MSDFLCAYCNRPFGTLRELRFPHVLPCGHSYCSVCILSMVGKNIYCSLCEVWHTVSSLDSLPKNQALWNLASSAFNSGDSYEKLFGNYVAATSKCLDDTESCLKELDIVSRHFHSLDAVINIDEKMTDLRKKFEIIKQTFQRLEVNLYPHDSSNLIDVNIYSNDDDTLFAKLLEKLSDGEKIYAAIIEDGKIKYGKVTERSREICIDPLTLTEREKDSSYFWMQDFSNHLREKISTCFKFSESKSQEKTMTE